MGPVVPVPAPSRRPPADAVLRIGDSAATRTFSGMAGETTEMVFVHDVMLTGVGQPIHFMPSAGCVLRAAKVALYPHD